MVTGTDFSRPCTIEGITRPDPRHHYGQIISWVICWPWNLLWTLVVHNPFRYIFQFTLHEIHSTLDEISTGEFSEIARDMDERAAGAAAPPLATSPSPSAQPTTAERTAPNTHWMEPGMEQEEESAIETVDEATFLAVASEPEMAEQSSAETIEESAAWRTLLKADTSAGEAANSESAHATTADSYKPPVLPPTHEPDPWYFAPNGRPIDPRTPESN